MGNDYELLTLLRKKDRQTFIDVYNQYYKLLYLVAYQILRNKEDSEDVVQNTFIKFMNNLDNFKDNSNIKNLLITIAKNESTDLYRKKKLINARNVELTEFNDVSEGDNTLDVITFRGLLNEEEALIVQKRVLEGYSFIEISQELNQTLGTIQAKYYKAIKTLKEHYKNGNKENN